MHPTENRLGTLVRRRREELGISQLELAHLAGISQSAVSRLERSGPDSPIPAPEILQAIAPHLHLTVDQMVRAAGYAIGDDDQEATMPDTVLALTEMIDRVDALPARAKRALHDVIELAVTLDREQTSG